MLLDADGDVVGEHVVLPLHVGCSAGSRAHRRGRFGDDIAPGRRVHHQPSLPRRRRRTRWTWPSSRRCFHGGELVAFCGSIAHKSDLGGVIPGTGVRQRARALPRRHPVSAGAARCAAARASRDVEAILRANSRTPRLVLGDIRGQIGVARLGERRLAETIERYGLETRARRRSRECTTSTERRMRAALAHLARRRRTKPKSFVDTDGDRARPPRPLPRARREDAATASTSTSRGCDDQVDGPINIQPAARARLHLLRADRDDRSDAAEQRRRRARRRDDVPRRARSLDPHFPAPHQHLHAVDARGHRSVPRRR